MIAKKYRLREYEVSRVFKKGRPFFGTYWTMNCLAVTHAKNHRMAVSISRKHDKRAVQRNRYRRSLYDSLLEALKSPSESYYQCVFTLKKGLKIPEKRLPDAWAADALSLFEKRK
ncbi:ribonuclease P protein component [Candidatus Gracilibacteria bacterium]|nr:ribonuclease P protein component [Candidatus Gracilibacteria bacterium]